MLSEAILASEPQSCSTNINTSNVTAVSNTDEVSLMLEEEPVVAVKEDEVSDELNVLLGDDVVQTVTEDSEVANVETVEPIIIPADEEYIESASFLNASPKAYTINITTTKGLLKAKEFVSAKGLDSAQAYTYEFGPGMKSAKVIYGTFNSVKEAKAAIANFSEEIKAGKPYIDNISKHQKLYKKYH